MGQVELTDLGPSNLRKVGCDDRLERSCKMSTIELSEIQEVSRADRFRKEPEDSYGLDPDIFEWCSTRRP